VQVPRPPCSGERFERRFDERGRSGNPKTFTGGDASRPDGARPVCVRARDKLAPNRNPTRKAWAVDVAKLACEHRDAGRLVWIEVRKDRRGRPGHGVVSAATAVNRRQVHRPADMRERPCSPRRIGGVRRDRIQLELDPRRDGGRLPDFGARR